MKRSEAAKYARWSASVALLLACMTAGVYLERKWVAHREREKAPPPAPQGATRVSSGLTFSKMDGDRRIFTVEASKSTDFKDKAASLLEDVKITIFGKTGERHDIIHTQSCQYESQGGGINCSGEVQMDLESAQQSERALKNRDGAAGQKVHAETRGVTFNRATGIAQTDQPVQFSFPNGKGEAVGVEYHSEEGALRLLKDVRLSLMPPANQTAGKNPPKSSARDPIHVTAKSLDFGRDSKSMDLHGPVRVETETAQLQSGELTLVLDAAFRAEKLVATAGAIGSKPQLQSRGTRDTTYLAADTMTARLAPEGWLTTVEGSGNVQGSRRGDKEQDDFNADAGALELLPKLNQPKELNLSGNVLLNTRAEKSAETRMLRTTALRVEFSPGTQERGSKPARAQTLGPGSIEWTDASVQGSAPATSANSAPARTKLQAEKLQLDFRANGRAEQLLASGNVVTERAVPGKPLQTAAAQNGIAQLLESGGWSQMDLQGDVKLKQGDSSGQAEHATFVRATQTALLTGKAVARDATTETLAPRITFVQNTGDIRAEGGVRSTDFSARTSGVQLAPMPAHISADTMNANSKTGRALYTGHARLWQGDSVLESDSIELLREAKILNASGNVRAVFPEAAAPSSQQARLAQATAKKPKLWHVSAGSLSYLDGESRAHLEKNVVAQSADQRMRGAVVDLYFTRNDSQNAKPAGTSSPSSLPAGAQQISRAVGTGGVIVDQGARRATSERGEYSAADGKFVMSGGTPTIYDAAEGTTTGRQLTFFLADDTIIVDSENGTRTLTKHRVDK